MFRWLHHGGFRRRNRECQPCVPARRAVGSIEFAVSSQAEEALHVAQGEDVSNLRTDTENPRPESAEDWILTGVVGDLLVGTAIFTEAVKATHIIRKVLLRELALLNYVNPF
jgi:hypothetical protein